MKILQCSDAHADKSLLGVSRFSEVERAFEQTVRAAVDQKVDLWTFTGDLCDPDDGPMALKCVDLAIRVARQLSKHNIPQKWVAGNHCVIDDGSGRTVLSPLKSLDDPLVRVHETGTSVRFGEINLVVLPYASGPNAYVPHQFVIACRNFMVPGKKVVLTHLSFAGAQLGDETTEMPRGADVSFPWEAIEPDWLVLGGHYHKRQIVHGPGGRKAYICGSMACLTFGEESNRPAYSIVEV